MMILYTAVLVTSLEVLIRSKSFLVEGCVSVCAYVYVCLGVCACVHVHPCVYVCLYVYVYLSVCMCISVCVCVCWLEIDARCLSL